MLYFLSLHCGIMRDFITDTQLTFDCDPNVSLCWKRKWSSYNLHSSYTHWNIWGDSVVITSCQVLYLALTMHWTQGFALGTLYVCSVKQARLQATFDFYWNWSQTYSLKETGCKPWPVCLQLYEMLLWDTDMNVCYFLSWWWETHLDLHLLCCKAKFSFILTVYFGPKIFPLVRYL